MKNNTRKHKNPSSVTELGRSIGGHRGPTIFILGSFHGNNIGDLAILESMVTVLQNNYNLIVLSKNPEVVSKRIGLSDNVEIVSPYNPFKILTSIIKAKKVVIGGGGLFFDKGFWDIVMMWKGSQIGYWWMISILSKILFTEVYWLGVSMGPLSKCGLLRLKTSLLFISNIHVRDKTSHRILIEKLKNVKAQKTADWVFLSEPIGQIKEKHTKHKNRLQGNIGICFKFSGLKKADINNKMVKAKAILSNLQREYPKANLTLFSTNPNGEDKYLEEISKLSKVPYIDTSQMNLLEFRKFMSNFSFLLSERMHALLIGFQEGVIGIGISKKTSIESTISGGYGKIAEFQRDLYEEQLFLENLDFDNLRKLLDLVQREEKELTEKAFENYAHLQKLAKDNITILD